jgi:hypoxanthine phosphoribosyltransferase
MSQSIAGKGIQALPQVVKEVVLDEATLIRRVDELAQDISRDYEGRELVAIGILKGAFMFTSDLLRRLVLPISIDFMAISRYDQPSPSGEVKVLKDVQQDLKGREVLLIEDIVDTGLTLNYLIGTLAGRGAASLKICTLLDRPDLRLVDIPIQYVGFNVNHEFLIGYGLDYRDHYRNLPFVASMNL